MHALGLLIESRMREKGFTFEDVGERGEIPRGTVWALANRPLSAPPRHTTVTRLAKGLELPVEVVEEAAAKAAGYLLTTVETSDPQVRLIAAVAEQLNPDDRIALAKMAEAYLSAAKDRNSKSRKK